LGLGGLLHSICKTETGFTEPSKPTREKVSLAKLEIVHIYVDLFVVVVAEIMTKSKIYLFYSKYIKIFIYVRRQL